MEQFQRRAGGRFPLMGYGGSLTDLQLQAEHDEQEQKVKEESDQKAKEQYEREKADVIKKLY